MTDLYDVLGVQPDADDTALKAAGKRARKRTHPDIPGGSREAFDCVQTALMVLSDPKKRERYDRTGKYDAEPEVDTETAATNALIAQCVAAVIFGDAPLDQLTRIDMVAKFRGMLDQPRREAQATIHKNKLYRARAEKLRSRFKRDGKADPLIERMLDFRVDQMDEQDEKCEALLARCDKADEILAGMTFEQEPDAAPGWTAMNLPRYQNARY